MRAVKGQGGNMKNTIPEINYLIFSGGGAAGIAFAGAVVELEKEPTFSYKDVKEVAGTSMGSIAALLVSLNYTTEEIMQKFHEIDLNKLLGTNSWPSRVINLYREYGLYESKSLEDILVNLIKSKTGLAKPEDLTFADMKKLGYKNLHVVATKLYMLNGKPTGKRKIFSAETTPDTSIVTAILASCAAPPYFERIRLKKVAKGKYVQSKDGDIYNDGGIVSNLAIDIFDKAKYIPESKSPGDTFEVNPHVLAFSILSADRIVDPWHLPQKSPITDSSPLTYGKALYDAVTNKNVVDGWENEKYQQRVVQIDRLGVSLAQFNIDETTKNNLVASGRLGVERYYQVLRNKEAYDMKMLRAQNKAKEFTEHKVTTGTLWQPIGIQHESTPQVAMKKI